MAKLIGSLASQRDSSPMIDKKLTCWPRVPRSLRLGAEFGAVSREWRAGLPRKFGA